MAGNRGSYPDAHRAVFRRRTSNAPRAKNASPAKERGCVWVILQLHPSPSDDWRSPIGAAVAPPLARLPLGRVEPPELNTGAPANPAVALPPPPKLMAPPGTRVADVPLGTPPAALTAPPRLPTAPPAAALLAPPAVGTPPLLVAPPADLLPPTLEVPPAALVPPADETPPLLVAPPVELYEGTALSVPWGSPCRSFPKRGESLQ
jgi:hypothetical protein